MRLRARPARLLGQVLHRAGQLGRGRQQHADLLRPRPLEVLRLHPHPEARPADEPQRRPTAMWDFWSLSPESLHQVTILFSDRGTPASYRHMNGYGSHTYSFLNANDERVWVKFHFKTKQGIKNFTGPEADGMRATDPDQATRDLFESIEAGEIPKWTLYVQIMPEGRRREDLVQPVRPHQGLAAQRLPADRGRRARTEPEPGKLLRRDRVGGLQPQRHRPGDRLQPRQDAPGPGPVVPRRPPLPPRGELPALPGQRPEVPGLQLPARRDRRRDAPRPQRRPRPELRAEQLRRPGPGRRVPRAAAAPVVGGRATGSTPARGTTPTARPATCSA